MENLLHVSANEERPLDYREVKIVSINIPIKMFRILLVWDGFTRNSFPLIGMIVRRGDPADKGSGTSLIELGL